MNATAQFHEFTISADYKGDKPAPFSDKNYQNYNRHVVTVRNRNTKARATFDFWASIDNPKIRTRSDLLGALECFLSDACAGEQDFHEFCSDFGYDEDSRKAEQTWKACQCAAAKVRRILGERDLYELSNELSEQV